MIGTIFHTLANAYWWTKATDAGSKRRYQDGLKAIDKAVYHQEKISKNLGRVSAETTALRAVYLSRLGRHIEAAREFAKSMRELKNSRLAEPNILHIERYLKYISNVSLEKSRKDLTDEDRNIIGNMRDLPYDLKDVRADLREIFPNPVDPRFIRGQSRHGA